MQGEKNSKLQGEESKATIELLQAALDGSLDVIQVFEAVRDTDKRIVDFTWRMNNKKGVEQNGDVIGQRLLAKNPGVVETGIFHRMVQVLETGLPSEQDQYYPHEQFDGWFRQTLVKSGELVVMTTRDITAQKKSEQEIICLKDEIAQKATDRYYSIFHSIDEGFSIIELILDEEGKVIDYWHRENNPAFERLTGIKEAVGKRMSELVPYVESKWYQMLEKIYDKGEPLRIEYPVEALGQWYTAYMSRVGGEGSRFIACVYNDITERKQQQQRQDFLLQLSDTLRPIADTVQVQEAVTHLAMEYFGADRCYYCEIENDQAIIRRDASKEGLPSVAGVYPLESFPILKAVIHGQKPFVVHDVSSTHLVDESLRQLCLQLQVISFMNIPIIKEGEPVGILCVVQSRPRKWTDFEIELVAEVAERAWAAVERAGAEEALRQSEKKYRTLFDSMDEGYCIIQMLYDETGKASDFVYLQVNRAFAENNGLYEAEGKTIRELTPDIEHKWIEIYARVAETGEPLRFEEDSAALGRIFSLYAFRIGEPLERKVAVIFTDITARKRTEKALRESENQLRKREQELMRVQEVGLVAGIDISLDPDLKHSHSWRSPEYRRLHGLFPDIEFETHVDWVRRVHPEDRQKAESVLTNALNNGALIYQNEYRIVRPIDGQVRWIYARVDIERDTDGKPIRLVGAHIDVTERKKVEQQLQDLTVSLEYQVAERTQDVRESKDLLQSIFDTSLIQMCVLKAVRDEQGRVVDFMIMVVNKELEKETGRTDLVGKLYAREYPWVKTTDLFDLMLDVLQTGNPAQMEYFYPHKGFDKWFSSMFVKLNDGLVATNLDVSERKRAELQSSDNTHFIEKMTIASPDNLFVMNIHTKEIVYTNRSPAEVLGYTKAQRAKMENEFLDIVHPEDFPRFMEHIENMVTAKDGEVRVIEYHVLDSQGNIRWMQDRNAVFKRDATGMVIEKIGVTHEVTQQKSMQEEVIRLRLLQQKKVLDAVLQSQEKERERIGEALHNGIGQLLYAAQIKCDLLSETDNHRPQLLKELTEILNEAITETRNISFELIPTVLRDFGLEVAIKTLLQRISHPALRIRFSADHIEDRLTEILEISIYRIVQELLNNIVKHSKASAANVGLAKTNQKLVLTVKDNGIGFDLNKVWGENKGVGLQSLRNRAKLLNAELQIRTAPGKGTKVTMEVPLL